MMPPLLTIVFDASYRRRRRRRRRRKEEVEFEVRQAAFEEPTSFHVSFFAHSEQYEHCGGSHDQRRRLNDV